jgi:Tfp pilus assembly protein PilF
VTHFIHRTAGVLVSQALLLCGFCLAQAGASATHIERAHQLIGEGKTDAAIAEYQAAVAVEPSNLEAQGNLGVLQFFAKGCLAAMPHLTAALNLVQPDARLQALAGICQQRQGKVEEGERNLTASLPLVTNPKIHNLILLNLVDIEYSRGDLQQASSNIAELIKSEPENPDVLYLAFRIYTDLADAARDELTIAAPDSARLHLLMAERFIKDGEATLAIHQYQETLAKDPSLPGVHFELGEAHLKQSLDEGSLARAQTELELALKENPRNAGAEGKLGVIEEFRGHINLAEEHFTRALSFKGDQIDALEGLGKILRDRGETEKAAEYLSKASLADPIDETIHYRLAQLYRELGRKGDSEREMKLFLQIRNLKSKSSLARQRTSGQ